MSDLSSHNNNINYDGHVSFDVNDQTGRNGLVALDPGEKSLTPLSTGMDSPKSKKEKRRQLAERIADIDLVVRKQKDLNQSVNGVKSMYELEKQERIEIQSKLNKYQQENEKLKDELEDEKYKNNQLQAKVDETKLPIDPIDLVKAYVELTQRRNELSRGDVKILNKLKSYCEKNGISMTNISKSLKKKSNLQVDAAKELSSLPAAPVLPRKPDTCTRGTQYDGIATTKVSCGTMTSDLIRCKDAATMYTEQKELTKPTTDEILQTMNSWCPSPISPIPDEPIMEPQTRDVGCCTNICDINKDVEFVQHIPNIKVSDSRPPSRLMCTDVKDEMPTDLLTFKERFEEAFLYNGSVDQPKFSSDMFVKLWPFFGHMMLSLMHLCSDTSSAARDEILNVLIRKMSESYQNFELDIFHLKPINFAMKDICHTSPNTNMCKMKPGPFKPIEKEKPKECNTSSESLSGQEKHFNLAESLSTTRKDYNESKENNETAVSFLSSQEMFNAEVGVTFGELDEGEKDLLAAANEPISLTVADTFSESTRRCNEAEPLSFKMSTEQIVEENIASEIPNLLPVEDEKTDESCHLETITNVSVGSECSNDLVIDEPNSDVDQATNETELSCLNNEMNVPSINVVTSLLPLTTETHLLESEVEKNQADTIALATDMPIAASAETDSVAKPLNTQTRKRKSSINGTQGICPVPCKRSARLEAKRLSEQQRIIFPIQIGNYTSRNGKCMTNPLLDGKTLRTNRAKDPNCDKIDTKLYVNENTTEVSTKSCDYSNSHENTSCKQTEKYSESNITTESCYDSPASPQPSSNLNKELNTALTPEIPTELCRSYYVANTQSLVDHLYKTNPHYLSTNMGQSASKIKIHDKKSIERMLPVLTEYLNNEMQLDPRVETRELCLKLRQISLNEELYVHVMVTLVEQLPEIKPETLERLMSAVQHLDTIYPSFSNELLAKLEVKLFIPNHKQRPKLKAALKMTQVYLGTIRLQATRATSTYINPLRIFIAKILYYFQQEEEGTSLIYEVMCQFPTVLPHREDRNYDHSDPLITVIKHLLMSCKYDMYNNELCDREMLSMLRFQYHFEPFKPLQQDVLKQLVDKLDCGKLEYLQLSFAVLCKRMSSKKVIEDVLNSRLLPLANTYYEHALQSSSYDDRIETLLTCISTILKALPLETDTSEFMSVFTRFLNAVKRQRIQEAAVQAILRLQRFGFEACGEALQHFRPVYSPNNLTMSMLRLYIQRKSQFTKNNKSKT